jgi:hypothetical protein
MGTNLIENVEVEKYPRIFICDVMVNYWEHSGSYDTPGERDYDFEVIHCYEVLEDGTEEEKNREEINELYEWVKDELDKLDWEELTNG